MSEFNKKYKDKSKSTLKQPLFENGKLQPSAVELEEAILGALMLDKESISVVADILIPESFYKEAHQKIYKQILALNRKSEPIDILTVTTALKQSGELESIGGAYYVTTLTNRVASSANTEFHARIVQQKYMQRELIRLSTETIQKCYDDIDVFDILDSTQSNTLNIVSENIRTREKDTTTAFREFTQHVENAYKNTDEITGVPTTIRGLDRITNGWQKSDLIIIAGRPAMGKTALTKACIKGAVLKKIPVAMFSLEMSTLQLMARIVSEEVGVPAQNLMRAKFEGIERNTNFDEINKSITPFYNQAKELLFIDDTPRLSIFELKARAKRMFLKYGIGLIIVDYLQLLDGSDENNTNRVQEVGEICRGLKALAKELNIPVIALSQLSRGVENERDKRPLLSHLRESGDIEASADLVIMLYRPEYYKKEGSDAYEIVKYKGQDIGSEGFAEAIIEKHRNGALGTIGMRFTDHLTKFEDYDYIALQNQNNVVPANPNQFIEPKNKEFETDIPPF